MSVLDISLVALISCAVALAVRSLVRARRAGGCASCPYAGGCAHRRGPGCEVRNG